MSVHHIIAKYGMDIAKRIIYNVSKLSDIMFFDMGQKDEQGCTSHGWWKLLPEPNNQEEWIYNYLKDNTEYTKITKIGSTKIHNTERLFWKLEK